MINYETNQHDTKDAEQKSSVADQVVVAVFASRAEARAAIKALHKAKYTHTWLGATSLAQATGGGETLTVDGGSFFAGTQSLVEALVSHGVSGDAARSIEGRIEPGYAIVTVDPKDKDIDAALDIIEEHGGRVSGDAATDDWGAWPSTARGDLLDDGEFDEVLFMQRR